MKGHIQEMLDIGAIHPSNSWGKCCGIGMAERWKLKFYIDLRRLNARMVKDAYSLPQINETLDCLNGTVWFTSLDLKFGYWQVEIEEDCKALTAFTIGCLGFCECDRMPF